MYGSWASNYTRIITREHCIIIVIFINYCLFQSDADTENKDNAAEQLRLRGKVIKYGDVIQVGMFLLVIPGKKNNIGNLCL